MRFSGTALGPSDNALAGLGWGPPESRGPTAGAGSQFVRWEVPGCSGTGPCVLRLDADVHDRELPSGDSLVTFNGHGEPVFGVAFGAVLLGDPVTPVAAGTGDGAGGAP